MDANCHRTIDPSRLPPHLHHHPIPCSVSQIATASRTLFCRCKRRARAPRCTNSPLLRTMLARTLKSRSWPSRATRDPRFRVPELGNDNSERPPPPGEAMCAMNRGKKKLVCSYTAMLYSEHLNEKNFVEKPRRCVYYISCTTKNKKTRSY